jgi:NAD+ diphosphatase
MLGFHATATSTEIKLQSNELDDARWFDRYELRNPGAAMRLPRPTSISRRLLDDWLEGA